jgi:hypothetical protein
VEEEIPIRIPILNSVLSTSPNFKKSPYFENKNKTNKKSSKIMGFKSLFHPKKKTDSANNPSLTSTTTMTVTTANSFWLCSTLRNKTASQIAELDQVFNLQVLIYARTS